MTVHAPVDIDLSAYARDWLAHPARAWSATPYARGRASIWRALKIEPSDRFAGYATSAFRILNTAEDETWIAGVIGAPPCFDVKRLLAWDHTQIRDVVLWNPRTGALRMLGQPSLAPDLIAPDDSTARIMVYGEGFAFFRAWADKRATTAEAITAARLNRHIVPVEPADSDIPGALAIGDINKLDWLGLQATVIVAGPGIDPQKLNRAIFRSARLPRVEAA